MSFCRWFGALLLVVGLFTLTGTLLPVLAQDKAPDKKDEKKKDEPKKDAVPKDAPKETTDGVLSPKMFKAFDFVKEGDFFVQEIKTKTTQKMQVEKQEVTQIQEQTFTIKWTPQKSTGTDLKVKQQIIGVKMDITIGSNKITYDSTDDKASQPDGRLLPGSQEGRVDFRSRPPKAGSQRSHWPRGFHQAAYRSCSANEKPAQQHPLG